MRHLLIILLLFLIPVYGSVCAEELKNDPGITAAEESNEGTTEEATKETTEGTVTKKISDILKDDDGIKEFKPMDFDKLGDKMLSFGDKSFETLQKFSVPMLIWGVVIGVAILFFGLIFGKKIILSGVTALVIVVMIYMLIRFFPEVMQSLINGVCSESLQVKQ